MTPWFGITCKHTSASIGRPQTTDSTPCGVSKYSIGPIFGPSVRKKAVVTKVKKTKKCLGDCVWLKPCVQRPMEPIEWRQWCWCWATHCFSESNCAEDADTSSNAPNRPVAKKRGFESIMDSCNSMAFNRVTEAVEMSTEAEELGRGHLHLTPRC